jgi:hypothetical protein
MKFVGGDISLRSIVIHETTIQDCSLISVHLADINIRDFALRNSFASTRLVRHILRSSASQTIFMSISQTFQCTPTDILNCFWWKVLRCSHS